MKPSLSIKEGWNDIVNDSPGRYGINSPVGPDDVFNWLKCSVLTWRVRQSVSNNDLSRVDLDVIRETI